MNDPNDPRAKGKTHGGSAPLVTDPQAGPCFIQFREGMGAVRAPMCPLTPCMIPTTHVPRGSRTVGARPLSWAPKLGHIQSIPGREGCSTGPHVPSNPMHDPIAPRAKDTTNRGSAPLVFARRHSDCIPLLLCLGSALALAFTAPFLGRRWCGVQNLIQGKVCGIRCWQEAGVGPTLHAHGQWDVGALRV